MDFTLKEKKDLTLHLMMGCIYIEDRLDPDLEKGLLAKRISREDRKNEQYKLIQYRKNLDLQNKVFLSLEDKKLSEKLITELQKEKNDVEQWQATLDTYIVIDEEKQLNC